MKGKQFAVLGLGVFGSTVATTLTDLGCEVLAVDKDVRCVERVADRVTKAVVGDITDREELEELGIGDFDAVIIGVGNHFEAAVLATMNVKDLGASYIVAKAKNKPNMQILQKIGADRVVRVEKEMGTRIAKSLLRKNIVDLVELDDDHSIIEINAPHQWLDKKFIDLNIRRVYNMNVIGIKHAGDDHLVLNIDPEYIIQKGDHFLVLGITHELERFDYMTD
ncbi:MULTISPECIES: TrkA family potassium uptake protein [Coprobacillaceae]|uniref:potassium channel family protein n=1 Tax=Coprobacillaceae TaxID=2810280 RepID=UPI000E46EFAC|nr:MULTISPECIES: TrkA family potassium uptake protein [Coprobacillaceae]RHM62845.1 TrkA family potassium uptake protein [Coprobacillus sp. AF33-1AC]RHS95016.1 TrkA family potassium uptake protein [Erysipelatoclostridium sp. AM42-17]